MDWVNLTSQRYWNLFLNHRLEIIISRSEFIDIHATSGWKLALIHFCDMAEYSIENSSDIKNLLQFILSDVTNYANI